MNEFNTVGNGDFISIVTTLEILFDKSHRFNCNKCVSQFCGRKNEEEMLKKLQTKFFCKSTHEKPVNFIKHNSIKINFFKCIGNFYDKSVEYLMTVEDLFSKGTLPEGNSVLDCPNKLIELIGLVEAYKSKLTIELREASNGQQ